MNKKPSLILIDGPIGAGKSTTANLLHKKMKRVALINLDMIKHFVSNSQMENLEETSLASNIGKAIAKIYLKDKISVIVEKAFTREIYIKEFIELAKKCKVKLFVYQIEAPLNLRIKRVGKRPTNWGAKKRINKKKIMENTLNYSRYKYKGAKVFDSSKFSPRKIVKEILRDIK